MQARTDAVKRSPRLSDLLRDLAFDTARERISIGDLCDTFKDRALSTLIFLLAAPNMLPAPPGLSAVTGLPLLLLTLQLLLGKATPWLPRWIRQRSFARSDFTLMLVRLEPWLLRLERHLRPRLTLLARPVAERLVAFVLFFLSFILILPIPLGNVLPGMAISVVALGIVERDGVCVTLGLLLAAVSLAVASGVVYGLALATWYSLTHVV